MPPVHLSAESTQVLGGIQNSPQDNRGHRPDPHSGLGYVCSIADTRAGGGPRISVFLGLIPFRFEVLVQSSDSKPRLGKSFIDRSIDLRIGAAQVKSSNPDLLGRRFGGNSRLVPAVKSVLQKVHPFDNMSNV